MVAPFCLDMFSGMGGWSAGAKRVLGCGTRFTAVDIDRDALASYRVNHPEAQTIERKLPACISDLLPSDRRLCWIFASPPCTNLSKANKRASSAERECDLDLVEWCARLMMGTACAGWWMEQVPTSPVIERLTAIRRESPDALDFEIFDFGRQFGVPQSRRRVLVSRQDAIRRLRDTHVPSVTVHDLLSPPYHAPQQRCTQLFSVGGHDGNKNLSLRSVHDASFTVTRNALYWASPTCPRFLKLSSREIATLQCFPSEHELPDRKGTAYRLLGNAIPPSVAEHCVAAARDCVDRHAEVAGLRARVAYLEARVRALER